MGHFVNPEVFVELPDLSVERLRSDKIGYATIPKEILFNPARFGLKNSVHKVYLYLLSVHDYVNPLSNKREWKLIKEAIMSATGLSYNTVSDALTQLKKLGLATWKKLSDAHTRWQVFLPSDLTKSVKNTVLEKQEQKNSNLSNINKTKVKKENNNAVASHALNFAQSDAEKSAGALACAEEKEALLVSEKIEALPCPENAGVLDSLSKNEKKLAEFPESVKKLTAEQQRGVGNKVKNLSIELQTLVLANLAERLIKNKTKIENPVGLADYFVGLAEMGELKAIEAKGSDIPASKEKPLNSAELEKINKLNEERALHNLKELDPALNPESPLLKKSAPVINAVPEIAKNALFEAKKALRGLR